MRLEGKEDFKDFKLENSRIVFNYFDSIKEIKIKEKNQFYNHIKYNTRVFVLVSLV